MSLRLLHSRRGALARHLIWLVLFGVLTGYKTWPLIAHMGDRILGDAGDPYLNAAILEWNYLTLFASGDWEAYRNLPFFYPHENVLSWSEHLFGYALLGWPVHLVTRNPAWTYNFLILSTLTLNGWAMCWLAYDRTRRMLPAVLAGLTLYSARYFVVQQGHLQSLPIFWGILALLAIHRWERSWSVRAAFLAGLCAAMLVLSGANLGAFFAVIFWLVVLILFIRRGGIARLRPWVGLITATVPTIAAYLLFFQTYAQTNRVMGHARDLEEIRAYSARPKHLAAPAESIPVWLGTQDGYSVTGEPASIIISTVPALMLLLCVGIQIRNERRRKSPPNRLAVAWLILFPISLVAGYNLRGGPGLHFVLAGYPYFLNWSRAFAAALGVLACVGLTLDLMRRARLARPIGLYLWITVLSGVLSFGPTIRRHHHELLLAPYGVLLKLLPALEGIRVPSRFAAVMFVGLAMLTALGVYSLRRRRIVYYGVAALAGTGLFFEWRQGNFGTAPFQDRADLRDAAEWIARTKSGASVVHLPLPPERNWRLAAYETPRMLFTLSAAQDGLSTLNGYSGYFSRLYDWMLDNWRGAWTTTQVHQAALLGVRYVLLDRSLPGAGEVGLERLESIERVRTFGSIGVYRLPEAPAPEVVPADHIWTLGAAITARGDWDPSRSLLEIDLPCPVARTLLFRDRYLGDVILDGDHTDRMVCGAAYLDTPFLPPGEAHLRARILLSRLPWCAPALSKLDVRFRLQIKERIPIPPPDALEEASQ